MWAACVLAGKLWLSNAALSFKLLLDDVRLAIVLRWDGALGIELQLLRVQVKNEFARVDGFESVIVDHGLARLPRYFSFLGCAWAAGPRHVHGSRRL